jgi:putative two-component system response regulator
LARFPDARVLVIDDEEHNLQLLTRILGTAGYRAVLTSRHPREILILYRTFQPDVILLDLHMPGLDGFGVLDALGSEIPPGVNLPIIVLTGDGRVEVRQRALANGARDFLIKPFDSLEVLLRLSNQLETRFLQLALEQQNRQLEGMVLARTRQLDESQLEVLERLASAAEYRDEDTGQHTQRVATLAEALAHAIDLEPERAELIRRAAPLHDVGKIAIPAQLLHKPARLTEEEFAVMRTHTTIGAQILAGGQTDLIRLAERVARSHHERWDGTGYPEGLAGMAIPIEARIVALADYFDALTHGRPYRPALPVARVTAEIVALSGSHFDPALVAAFVDRALSTTLADADARLFREVVG